METREADAADDWALAERAREGDEPAYAELIARYQTPIHRFICRHVGDEETARDLTQEVFVKAWFALGRVTPRARFTTWLFQIALNLCRDHAKSRTFRQQRVTRSFSVDQEAGRPEWRDFPHPNSAPDRQAELSEALDALDEEIRRLPDDLRQPLLLGVVESHSYKEVAAMLRISAKAVEVRIYRARRILAERLARLGLTDSNG